MIPIRHVVPAAVASIIRKAPLTPEKVAFAWRSAVGAAIDHVTSVRWEDGVLVVEARDRAWQQEIRRSSGLIQSRLDAALGAGAVRRIVVRSPRS